MRCVIVMDIRVRIDRPRDTISLTLTGDLDMAAAGRLSDAVDAFAAVTFASVVMDLAEVGTIDCAGLSSLAAAGQRIAAAGGALTLTRPPPDVRRWISQSGCAHLLRRPAPTERTAPASLVAASRRTRSAVIAAS